MGDLVLQEVFALNGTKVVQKQSRRKGGWVRGATDRENSKDSKGLA